MRIGRVIFGPPMDAAAVQTRGIVNWAFGEKAKGRRPFYCGHCGRTFDHSQFEALGVTWEDHTDRCSGRREQG